jgi:ABC-type hemin transport system substrate-binding protein
MIAALGAAATPPAIIVHRWFDDINDGEKKIEILQNTAEIADTEAIRNGKIYTIGIKKSSPASAMSPLPSSWPNG